MNFSQFTGYISWLTVHLSYRRRVPEQRKPLYNKVIKDNLVYPEYSIPAAARNKYLYGPDSGTYLLYNTHGATGSETGIQMTLSQVVRKSSISLAQGRLLFRICRFYKPFKVFELGTSAGISTLYLALGCAGSKIFTVEGNTGLSKIAASCFEENGIKNIRILNASFTDALNSLKAEGELQSKGLKLVFIDGDHSYLPVTGYFGFLRENLTPPYILAFHDIYWSAGMRRAWNEIAGTCKRDDVLDLFSLGLVFNGVL